MPVPANLPENLLHAAVEAIRALRNDERLDKLPIRSIARKELPIRSIARKEIVNGLMSEIAGSYGVEVKELARTMVEMLKSPEEAAQPAVSARR